jgi:hypothetical protein
MSRPPHAPPPSGASHVLVAAPPLRSVRYELCRSLLTARGAATDVLSVAYRRPVPEQFADLEPGPNAQSPQISVVNVGPASAPLEDCRDDLPVETAVTSVPATDSLTELGMTVEGHLQDFADDSRPTALCFDSLTSMSLYAGPSQADRFLDWLCSRVDAIDGHAHYHADPVAHDSPLRERFGDHFDEVIEVGADGTVETSY